VRHAPEEAPRALEDALARIAAYAGAHEAVLSQDGDSHAAAPTRLIWSAGPQRGTGSRIELPLVVGGRRVGALALRRRDGDGHWPIALVARLGAAAKVLADAVERARTARAADEARRQVAHLGRVALVGELAAAISHELRQPLTAIRANAELGRHLLTAARPAVDDAKQLFDDIVADDQRASQVIEHIRLLLRKQETGEELIDLRDVARDAVMLLTQDARRRAVKLVLLPSTEWLPVMANAVELRQVALNLVLNALEATAGTEGARQVVVGAGGEGGEVELFVRDSGPGLSPAVQARIFDSFFSTKQQGLGLGLVIVRSIVQRHGGRVTAENVMTGGAEFRVSLPAAAGMPSLSPPITSRARQVM
jgi:C4-dicarboxylate-specific signal transduction histidine kinase